MKKVPSLYGQERLLKSKTNHKSKAEIEAMKTIFLAITSTNTGF